MSKDPRDPRSEAEKARADLMRNDAMGLGVPESPLERQPSVTPQTFGDTTERGRLLSGTDQGVEAGGPPPGRRAGDAGSAAAEAEQVSTGRDGTAPTRPENDGDEDVLSRGKE